MKEELTNEWINWVNTSSGSSNQEGLKHMADLLESRLKGLKGAFERFSFQPVTTLEGKVFKGGDAVRLRFNETAPIKVLFSGHMDTVFGESSPFQRATLSSDGLQLKGPGVTDMKGGLLIMIEAVRRWLNSDEAHKLGGEILITADEEVGSPASIDLLVAAAEWNDVGLVFESALPGGEIVENRKGTGTFVVTAKGRSAHTGRDFEKGRNALSAISYLSHLVHQWNGENEDIIANVGLIEGGGPVNVVPDNAEVHVNIRIGHLESVDWVKAAFETTIAKVKSMYPGIEFNLSGDFTRPPKIFDEASKELYEIWTEARASLNMPESGMRSTGGSSDGNIFTNHGLPLLDGIGVRGNHIHSHDEFAIVDSLEEQIQTTLAFLKILGKRGSLA